MIDWLKEEGAATIVDDDICCPKCKYPFVVSQQNMITGTWRARCPNCNNIWELSNDDGK